MAGIKDLVAERAKTHGNFSDTADTAQYLRDVMRSSYNWKAGRLSNVQKEALDNIVAKLARILTGDPQHQDAWIDITGYCQLYLERLNVST